MGRAGRFVIDASILRQWREGGAETDFVQAMEALQDRELSPDELQEEIEERLDSRDVWDRNTWQKNLPDVRVVAGPSTIFRAEGYLGQHLVIIPAKGLVAVRMIRAGSWKGAPDNLSNFTALVRALVP